MEKIKLYKKLDEGLDKIWLDGKSYILKRECVDQFCIDYAIAKKKKKTAVIAVKNRSAR